MKASKDVWSNRFNPYLDAPVRPSVALGNLVGHDKTTRRRIVLALVARFRPERPFARSLPLNFDICELFGLDPSRRTIILSRLLTYIDNHVSPADDCTVPVTDQDLIAAVRGLQGTADQRIFQTINLLFSRFDYVLRQPSQGTADRLRSVRLYNYLRIAAELLAACRKPGPRLFGLVKRAIDLAITHSHDRALASGLAQRIRILSYSWIMQLGQGSEAWSLWRHRAGGWEKVGSPILDLLNVTPVSERVRSTHAKRHRKAATSTNVASTSSGPLDPGPRISLPQQPSNPTGQSPNAAAKF